LSETRDEYLDRNEDIALFIGAIAFDRWFEKTLRKKGLSKLGLATPLVVQKFAVEATGLSLAYAINGDEGVEDWMEFSNEVYDWGFVGDVPILGSIVELFPNPVALGEKQIETAEMAITHFYDKAFGNIEKLFRRNPLDFRRYTRSWTPEFLR